MIRSSVTVSSPVELKDYAYASSLHAFVPGCGAARPDRGRHWYTGATRRVDGGQRMHGDTPDTW